MTPEAMNPGTGWGKRQGASEANHRQLTRDSCWPKPENQFSKTLRRRHNQTWWRSPHSVDLKPLNAQVETDKS
ncbi:MAG: hypothetical protein NHB32_25050 [Fischerella sp. CENA71]|nr:hypothetical protein [Fischerella sp. CENA71]